MGGIYFHLEEWTGVPEAIGEKKSIKLEASIGTEHEKKNNRKSKNLGIRSIRRITDHTSVLKLLKRIRLPEETA